MPTAAAPLTVEATAITVCRLTIFCASSPVLGCIVPEVVIRSADIPDENENRKKVLVCIVWVCCGVPLICLSVCVADVLRKTVSVVVKIGDVVVETEVCPSV